MQHDLEVISATHYVYAAQYGLGKPERTDEGK
jgi:hypothetical protein